MQYQPRFSFRSWFYLVVTITAWINMILNVIIEIVPGGNQYNPQKIIPLFGHLVDLPYGIFYYIVLFATLYEVRQEADFKVNYTLYNHYTAAFLWLGISVLNIAALLQDFGQKYLIPAQLTYPILLTIWLCVFLTRQARILQSVQVSAIQAQEKENQSKQCEICQKESSTNICLACQGKYRGEIQRINTQNFRAMNVKAPATLTLKEWITTLDTFHWHCAYCHGPFEAMEHYIPLPDPKGGTTAENCVPTCHKCNLKKSNKHPEKMK